MTVELFALKWPSGIFHQFWPSLVQMGMCGDPPYYRVRLMPDPDGEYWTWHDLEKNTYNFTNNHEMGVEICFPYGSAIETKFGRGKIIRVRVEELGTV